jgi:hypothetical protein
MKTDIRGVLEEILGDLLTAEEQITQEVEQIEMPMPQMNFPGYTFKMRGNDSVQQMEAGIQELERANDTVITEIAFELDGYLKLMMAASWGWSDGSRNIIDTGSLMSSGGAAVVSGKIEIAYDSPYAALIHYGGYIQPYGNVNVEKVYIPGRPWIAAALGQAPGPIEAYDFERAYEEKMRRAMS